MRNPVTKEQRPAIWKWINENCIQKGLSRQATGAAVNHYFFDGRAEPEWIEDILSGRKTPFKRQVREMWKSREAREAAEREARDWLKGATAAERAKGAQ